MKQFLFDLIFLPGFTRRERREFRLALLSVTAMLAICYFAILILH